MSSTFDDLPAIVKAYLVFKYFNRLSTSRSSSFVFLHYITYLKADLNKWNKHDAQVCIKRERETRVKIEQEASTPPTNTH